MLKVALPWVVSGVSICTRQYVSEAAYFYAGAIGVNLAGKVRTRAFVATHEPVDYMRYSDPEFTLIDVYVETISEAKERIDSALEIAGVYLC